LPPYAKVFAQILDSTIANHYHARHLFEDLLKLCDWNGVVDLTPAAIARRTGFPGSLLELGDLLLILEAPDPESRTPDHDGRRIVRLEETRSWGWRIVNFELYRDAQDPDRVRTVTRERVRRFRAKRAAEAAAEAAGGETDVTDGNASKRHKDGDGNKEKERVSLESTSATGEAGGQRAEAERAPVVMPEAGGEAPEVGELQALLRDSLGEPFNSEREFATRWARYPRKEKRDRSLAAWKASVKTRADAAAFDRALENYLPHARAKAAEDPTLVMQGGTFFGGRWREWVQGNPVGVKRAPSADEIAGLGGGTRQAEAEPFDHAAEEAIGRERRRQKFAAVAGLVKAWTENGHGEIPEGKDWTAKQQAFLTYTGVTPAAWRRLAEEFGGEA
jgi:hypothetical protein